MEKKRNIYTNKPNDSHSGIDGMAEIAQLYRYSPMPTLSQDEIIEVKKKISRVDKGIRQKIKGDTCRLCENSCSSFCRSHSIPEFVLENIAENGDVSAPRQKDDLEPLKKTGTGAAGVFFNICRDCDSHRFQNYEQENAYRTLPSDEMLTEIAIKNYLKWMYTKLVDTVGEKFHEEKGTLPILIKHGAYLPTELDLQEYQFELERLLSLSACGNIKRFHLQYYKELNYRIPFAAQYLIAMLADLEGNLINDIFNPEKSYHMEYLHVAIFPLENTSAIFLFTREGQTRHRRFVRQLNKLSELDQLATINFLTFSGTDNVFLNPSVYQTLTNNADFMDVCRMTYSVNSIVPNPNSHKIVMEEHSFSKRNAIPNLLAPEYAL